MFCGNVRTIGNMPDGTTFTGFCIECGKEGYLILLQEVIMRDIFTHRKILRKD